MPPSSLAVSIAALVSTLVLLIGAFFDSQVCRILFLVFNGIFVICMAVMIGLMYSNKMDGGPGEAAFKTQQLNGVVAFTFMFVGAALEVVVAIS